MAFIHSKKKIDSFKDSFIAHAHKHIHTLNHTKITHTEFSIDTMQTSMPLEGLPDTSTSMNLSLTHIQGTHVITQSGIMEASEQVKYSLKSPPLKQCTNIHLK